MKKVYLLLSLVPVMYFAQIGVNTGNPRQEFHIDAGRDNPVLGNPSVNQASNDFVVTATGNTGIGTVSPTAKLELNSGTVNSSGLKFSNLSSSSPVSSGATLGIDDTGNVVTVQGSSFSPAFGRVVLSGANILIPAGTANYNLIEFTLPSAGTYLITFSTRAQVNNTAGQTGQGFATAFLSTAASAGSIVPNTEILIYNVTNTMDGGTGTGTLVTTITAPTVYYLGARSSTRDTTINNNTNGRTSVSFVKVTP
ncbi:hypothetical protein VUJ46_01615 [Chryseobacterium sp. MYb264]|uniref:hypothetical protein n=1 Tax=Chryseobacterium sp. MYb264 TaxID=2745153 RepID=UPI002E11FA86|nr:hypothetical protein VUJ46_01615 [Chryseobacterium sp. MYb264]